MLEFCAAEKIKPQVTGIPTGGINDAWSKVVAKQARYRFVMDMKP
jgi:D-arabinose 1-dehydrogenase-like Zn-dependent alcohol dehydrogenase